MPVAPVCHIIQSRSTNAATFVTATISTNLADSDGALYYESLKCKVGSPNVPPGSASRIVQVSIANAAFQTVPAIAANLADSQKTKGHRVALSIPIGNVGSPTSPTGSSRYRIEYDSLDSSIHARTTTSTNPADSNRAYHQSLSFL